MDQGNGVKHLPWPIVGETSSGELAQVLVEDGKQLCGGPTVAAAGRLQAPGHVGHGCPGPGKGVASQILTSTAFAPSGFPVEMIRSPLGLNASPPCDASA